jgi:hypothetical protein
MKVILTFLAFFLVALLHVNVYAQGCVAIRHFSCGGNNLSVALMNPGDLTVGANYRYFRSFRHFRGREENPDRVANNTEVINHAHALDLNLSYGLSHRMYLTATFPIVVNERSSLYEHGRDERHSSFSRGIADIRVGMGYWLLNPASHPGFNAALGLGLKLPTGNYNATDLFYNVGAEEHPEVRPVDQSIQPGDGGMGLTVDFQVYQHLMDGLSWYGNGFYLFNPRETNGIRTFRETLSPILANESIMSVPDQFSFRFGLNYAPPVNGVSTSLGVRYEGVPVEDLIGGSEGFRRPGSVFSVEPGVSYMTNTFSLSASVPIALIRNRPQSVTDRETELLTGNPRNGDAAFADYLINLGFTYRLRSGQAAPETF